MPGTIHMKQRKLLRQVRYYAGYFPFTVNALLCTAAALAAYAILYGQEPEATSSVRPFILLMGKMIFWFGLTLLCLSMGSTLASWLYYRWLRSRNKTRLAVSFTPDSGTGGYHLNVVLEGVRRPLLGFVTGRLFYDDGRKTDAFSLISNKRKRGQLLRTAITGKNRLLLPDIKEYEIRNGLVFFQDMFRVFSLAAAEPIQGHFYQPPVSFSQKEKEISPRKTEDTTIRIDELRRVDGEYLSYKDFEAGDDVRRIVWKLYAKNRNLVVRVPEMFEPYASHIYYYASFYAVRYKGSSDNGYMREMLNYYKNNVWTVYETLSRKEQEVRYIPDLEFHVQEQASPAAKAAAVISRSYWHREQTPVSYFNARHGAVLCISSFTGTEQLKQLLAQSSHSSLIFLVKCSHTFRHPVAWNWLKRLLLLPPKDRLGKLRGRWIFTPLRLRVLQQEKALELLMKENNIPYSVL